ncbi:MAG: hypothetical protein ACYSX0_01040 [Planctomycetota bacterium]
MQPETRASTYYLARRRRRCQHFFGFARRHGTQQGFDDQGRLLWRLNPDRLLRPPDEDPPQVREPQPGYAGCKGSSGERITAEVPLPYG